MMRGVLMLAVVVVLCVCPWLIDGGVAVSKKGVTYGSDPMSDSAKCADLVTFNVSWYYTWGYTPACIAGVKGVEFVPMVWSAGSLPIPSPLPGGSDWLLGFNEPNITPGQANMTPAQAASLWPQLEATGRRLVGPAVADCGGPGGACNYGTLNWYRDFLGNCSQCRVDAVALHLYFCDAQDAVNKLTALYELTQRPIWLTEFACNAPTSASQTSSFASALLPRLESLAVVQRYSWFIPYCGGCGAGDLLYSSLTLDQTGTGNLTAVGRIYSALQSTSQATVSPGHAVNIDCGNLSPSQDASAEQWLPDQLYSISSNTTTQSTLASMTPSALSDAYVFQTYRAGPAQYEVPVSAYGVYNISLLLSEYEMTAAGLRVFDVLVQGVVVASHLDIFQVAGGQNIAVQLQCLATVDAGTGLQITVALRNVVSVALIAGLSISAAATLPTSSSYPSTVYLNFGGAPSVDTLGHSWTSPALYLGGGTPSAVTDAIANTSAELPQFVYQSYEFGALTLSIPVTVSGAWNLTLLFVETYWTSAGQRVFDLFVQETLVVAGLDIFARAGGKDVAYNLQLTAEVSSDLPYIIVATTDVVDHGLICGMVITPPAQTQFTQPLVIIAGGGSYTAVPHTGQLSSSSSSGSTATHNDNATATSSGAAAGASLTRWRLIAFGALTISAVLLLSV
jgi:Glycosyl hydrolase catalytic core/Malectin domain